MTERPILFSGPMVRAILDGTKTQTRRIVTGLDPMWLAIAAWRLRPPCRVERDGALWDALNAKGDALNSVSILCPYGPVGGRLWVRETWIYVGPGSGSEIGMLHEGAQRENHKPENCWYRADPSWDSGDPASLKWTPSIHMPRWASRLTLEVTDVRVQRLQDISLDDARAEGIPQMHGEAVKLGLCRSVAFVNGPDGPDCRDIWDNRTSVDNYRALWDSINAKRAPWDSNPWTWAITFRRIG